MAVFSLLLTTRFKREIHLFVQAVKFRVHESPVQPRDLMTVHGF